MSPTLWPRRQPLLGGGAAQQQLALLAPQESYQSSRAVALQNVERTIHELGAIFQDLALMVRPAARVRVPAPRQGCAAQAPSGAAELRVHHTQAVRHHAGPGSRGAPVTCWAGLDPGLGRRPVGITELLSHAVAQQKLARATPELGAALWDLALMVCRGVAGQGQGQGSGCS